MKPVVSAANAWSCFIISIFAIIILSILGSLFKNNHHSVTGSTKDPENGPAVAASIFTAVAVYAESCSRENLQKTNRYHSARKLSHAAHALTARPPFLYSSSWYFAAYKPSYTSERVEEAQYR
ncbi:hypothetical protein PAAG_00414 [Paracoccidioides lutzii Pb01]|uniref:Uncharacterized protein n=1 Tax=Paracoccidioides lutzii (strain ATCC MYA-826 / Pb01) TaxID=502779 RepID=C1GPG9_PARBA|nr:hypothetical protein PAAG_00414 [Paracoccidioides lutzii Pb01]EEH36091.1 hypothetical protein PAAG_00414 [Paracoccidioides lutzii Pb01]